MRQSKREQETKTAIKRDRDRQTEIEREQQGWEDTELERERENSPIKLEPGIPTEGENSIKGSTASQEASHSSFGNLGQTAAHKWRNFHIDTPKRKHTDIHVYLHNISVYLLNT